MITSNKISRFDAQHKRMFSTKNSNLLVTPRQKIGHILSNCNEWVYSMHWPDDDGWIDKAQKDLQTLLKCNAEEFSKLKTAENILSNIEGPEIDSTV